jgi:hypothetical protein
MIVLHFLLPIDRDGKGNGAGFSEFQWASLLNFLSQLNFRLGETAF